MVIMPLSVSVFGYIAMESDVKIFFPGGKVFFLGLGVLFINCIGLV